MALGGIVRGAVDDGNVGAGAAHVEGDEPREARGAPDMGGADDAGGRSGHQGLDRALARGEDRHHPAVRFRGEDGGGDAERFRTLVETLEIAPHRLADIGIHDGGERALVFAELRPDVG